MYKRQVDIAAEAAFPENGDTFDGVVEQIGTGRWVLKEYQEGQYAVFERNEYYWGEKPKFKEVKAVVIPDPDTVANALRAGEVQAFFDVNNAMSVDTFKSLEAEGFTTACESTTTVSSLSLNTGGEVLRDVNVRLAIEYATDNTVIAEHVFAGLEEPASAYFAKSVPYTDTGIEPYSQDLDKAKAILEEAGWLLDEATGFRAKDGKTLEFDMLYDNKVKTGKDIGLILQDQYAQAGIKMNIVEEDSKVFRQRWKDGDFGAILYNSWGGSYEPFSTLAAMKDQGDKFSTVQAGLENKSELDEVMLKSLSETDPVKLQEYFDYIMATFHDQAVYVPTTVVSNRAVCSSELTGLKVSDMSSIVPLETLAYK